MNSLKIFGLLSFVAILAISFKPLKTNDDNIVYYKPKYSDDNYYRVLSSGNDSEIGEVWGVEKDDIEELPILNLEEIKFNEIAQRAKEHLEKRFNEINLILLEVELGRINSNDLKNNRNWIIIITYQYNDEGHIQKIPLLIDGRIILSTYE